MQPATTLSPAPFAAFAPPLDAATPPRRAITAAHRRDEADCVAALLDAASFSADERAAIRRTAGRLVAALRAKRGGWGVEGLVQEYDLSSQEGVALMCLAEALLRIPDAATRDALIRDKIAGGDWGAHLGGDRTLFVNAASWGLAVTGKLVGTPGEAGLTAALTRLVGRCGEPVIRAGVDMAMRMMGRQFVTGETIAAALDRAAAREPKGFSYSFDMLGEAAMTAADAARYQADYVAAIAAIGKAAAGRGIHRGPGISIKLSALHPRYTRAQAERVKAELGPRLKQLALLARGHDIGMTIDAEESERLDLSLDLFEALCLDPDLAGWNGLGFVVQAYQKRAPFVIDFFVDLGRRAGRRLMVRLVKGAYWDAEIKRTQVEGLADYPVFTRKVHTDVSYLACARRLLAAPDAVFAQFATHNAHTVAAVHEMAGPNFAVGAYEFQCLHGMGEPLYDEVVGPEKLDRPCRIYAPVGTHETLLAYLVRRLLENGANSSFVNRIADPAVPVEALTEDPADAVRAETHPGAPHDRIALPADLYGPARKNSAGIDLANEAALADLAAALTASAARPRHARPLTADGAVAGPARPVVNPGDHADVVGTVVEADAGVAARAVRHAATAAAAWAATPVEARAACLERAADRMQADMADLMGLAMREAGKSAANAVAEVREAIDFLRYYAAEARRDLAGTRPLGPVVCISPWNFPLAIFTGQVAAALAAGNPVLAKPAEETPLMAAEAVGILHEAGVPADVLQLVPGDGDVGAALVAAPETAGVLFTGSTEVARLIHRQLAGRVAADGRPIPLVAETGGQNALIVDSSALAEQVVGDVLASAFDSAGQRCSALRVLCLQEEVAERILAMLKGALAELALGRTDTLAVDIGPVISAEARTAIEAHVAKLAARGKRVERRPLPGGTEAGSFVAPTIIEIGSINELEREVFGPVLHVLRFRRDALERTVDAVNATGYGLTFGLHTRLDDTVVRVAARIRAGNLYVNRNIIGAVVGVQPFGGRGLSGTGPKAGGPLYLGRLVQAPPPVPADEVGPADPAALALADWLAARGAAADAIAVRAAIAASRVGTERELPGPVGERNLYALRPRGRILLVPETETGLWRQLGAALAAGNVAVVDAVAGLEAALADLPAAVAGRLGRTADWAADGPFAGALIEGDAARVRQVCGRLADLPGPVVVAQAGGADGSYCLDWLVEEVSTSINTAAAGGNASLMAIG